MHQHEMFPTWLERDELEAQIQQLLWDNMAAVKSVAGRYDGGLTAPLAKIARRRTLQLLSGSFKMKKKATWRVRPLFPAKPDGWWWLSPLGRVEATSLRWTVWLSTRQAAVVAGVSLARLGVLRRSGRLGLVSGGRVRLVAAWEWRLRRNQTTPGVDSGRAVA